MQNKIIIFILNIFFLCNITPLFSEENPIQTQTGTRDGFLEELEWLQAEDVVFTASRHEQKLSETAASVFVITQEDVRRSGLNSIPELLRMVPGLHVARIDANKWAISIRGSNDRYANKLLVLIDGRSVYTPLFSGVYWDVQDTLLEDIERIEVVRGPGGTLWGANAVNGIINIITKNAKDTQKGLMTGSFGEKERGMGGLRYGGKIGNNAYFRVFGKYYNHDRFSLAEHSDEESKDNWDMKRGGYRIDWDLSNEDSLTFQGDIYNGNEREARDKSGGGFSSENIDVSGGNALGRWKHIFSNTSNMALQMYYDRTNRKTATLRENRYTFDIDFQHRFRLGNRNELIWGLGYRFTQDDTKGFSIMSLDPNGRGDNLFSAFIQEDISLIENKLNLIIGSKFEYNDYTGFEIQPSLRAIWRPTRRQTVWASASRAVRTPSRIEETNRLEFSFPSFTHIFTGNRDLESEDLFSLEAGYRIRPTKRLSLDITTFYNLYDKLINAVFDTGFFIQDTFANAFSGETYGIEAMASWNATESWELIAGYTYFEEMNFQAHEDIGDIDAEELIGGNPHNQFNVRSLLDLPCNLQLDTALFYVDSINVFDTAGEIHKYFRFDARIGWQPTESLDISIVGTNLLDDKHTEYKGSDGIPSFTEIERAVYARITWKY